MDEQESRADQIDGFLRAVDVVGGSGDEYGEEREKAARLGDELIPLLDQDMAERVDRAADGIRAGRLPGDWEDIERSLRVLVRRERGK